MSKLLGLREWLTIKQAVKYAETILGENVEAKDLIPIVFESGVVRFSFLSDGAQWFWCEPFSTENYKFPTGTCLLGDIGDGCRHTETAEFMPIPDGNRYKLVFGQSSHLDSVIWLESPETGACSPAYRVKILGSVTDLGSLAANEAMIAEKWSELLFDTSSAISAFYVHRIDLENLLRNGTPSPQVVQSDNVPKGQLKGATAKSHGNAEHNAKRRLNVLTAACQVKIHFPDCLENKPASSWAATDWAEALDAKAPLFWPDTGKPPLERSVIVDLLREAMRKP